MPNTSCKHLHLQASDAFCPECGMPADQIQAQRNRANTESTAKFCAACGMKRALGDRFCSRCGSSSTKHKTEAQSGNATYQSPIREGDTYHCPKCNAILTPGLKICQVCGASFMFPVPRAAVSMTKPAATRQGNGTAAFIGIMAVLAILAFGLFTFFERGKGMSGIYTDSTGLTTITFQRDGKYWYRGFDNYNNFNGVYELKGNQIRLLPPQEQWDKLPPSEKNNPWLRSLENSLWAPISDDRNTFNLYGVEYRRQ